MVISNLISNGSIKKGILLVGDTILKTCSREDKSTYPLFGDAGSATGMEFDDLSEGLKFHMESVDFFVFHQANLFMNEKIRKKLKIPKEKVPYTLNDFGNTSSASIPLTIVNELGNKLKKGNYSIIACGFGVGLSWGSVWFQTTDLVCSELIEI